MFDGLIGYCDPWSARPGDKLSFKISSPGGKPFRARVVRVRHADPNPAGPGIKLVAVEGIPIVTHRTEEQHSHPGSNGWARCPKLPTGGFQVVINLRCLRLFEQRQCIWAIQNETGSEVCALTLRDGFLELLFRSSGRETIVASPIRIEPLVWFSIAIEIDGARSRVAIDLVSLPARAAPRRVDCQTMTIIGGFDPDQWQFLSIAALQTHYPTLCLDGQLEAPAIGAGPMPDLEAIGGALQLSSAMALAAWDFSQAMKTQSFVDAGPAGLDGVFRNLPTRAMKGSNWDASEMCWRHAPGQYGAVHFHSDDVGDLNWNESVSLHVPETLPSGVYALQIDNDAGSDQIPFYVLPPRNARSTPKVVFLAPTMTYLAYANHARGNWDGALAERAHQWGAFGHNPDVARDFGFSTYNYHPDGSGVALSTRRRPVLTLRPGYLTFPDERGSGLRHFPDDTHLLDWLEAKNIDFDVVTDEDLDREGAALIDRYTVLVTGSHPEYHTQSMLNALESFRRKGGNLCYMGGNGFYWRIARSPEYPDVLEIRRAESGIRAWASEPGEYYNQLDGQYGGLWRRNGRPPQSLAEIGFAVQGLFEGSYYLRTAESSDFAASWIFDGVEETRLGEYGLSGGGAAGFELDQVSRQLGTAPDTIVLARSTGHGPSFKGVPEDILTHTLSVGGAVAIEAHMVYGWNDAGSQVFATGSITFIGSLSHNNYDNDVSRLFYNVLARFQQGTRSTDPKA
jgi:N,N-dimethylformamidase